MNRSNLPPILGPRTKTPPKRKRWLLPVGLILLAPLALLALTALYAWYQETEAPLHERNGAGYNSVVNNLRLIENAKDQWQLEHRRNNGETPTASDLTPYLKGMAMPVAVRGELYNLNPIGTPATATTTTKMYGMPIGSTISIK